MLVAMMMEGKFSGEGLQAFDDDGDDMLSAMARELVEKAGVGASADAIWHDLERERGRQLAASPKKQLQNGSPYVPDVEEPEEPASVPETPNVAVLPVAEEIPVVGLLPAAPAIPVPFVAYCKPRPKHKKVVPFPENSGQLPLFAS
jgi:hypothetical protein